MREILLLLFTGSQVLVLSALVACIAIIAIAAMFVVPRVLSAGEMSIQAAARLVVLIKSLASSSFWGSTSALSV